MLLVACLSIAAIVVVPTVLLMRARSAKRRAAVGVVVIDGREVQLPSAVWAVASSGAADQVGTFLVETRFKEAQEVAGGLTRLVENLSADEQSAIATNIERLQRARAERQLWNAQTERIAGAASVGALDGLLLSLGENPEWFSSAFDTIGDHLDLSHTIVGTLAHSSLHAARHLMPGATTSLVDHVDHVVGPTIDHATDAVADSVGHGIAAIADSHIPVFTIGRAVYRAQAATDAGLEAGRVRTWRWTRE